MLQVFYRKPQASQRCNWTCTSLHLLPSPINVCSSHHSLLQGQEVQRAEPSTSVKMQQRSWWAGGVSSSGLSADGLRSPKPWWGWLTSLFTCTLLGILTTATQEPIPISRSLLCTKSCPTFCDPHDYSPPDSSVHGILQPRILEWIAIPFSRGSSWPRDET